MIGHSEPFRTTLSECEKFCWPIFHHSKKHELNLDDGMPSSGTGTGARHIQGAQKQ
jgi:hypothetical protein